MSQDQVNRKVTEKIVAMLEKGELPPWTRPWNMVTEAPRNLVSKFPYRGSNIFFLLASGYKSPYWLSYKQAAEMGGCVRKGERGTPVIFWKPKKFGTGKFNADGKEIEKNVPLVRYYTVFNTEQIDGISDKVPPIEVEMIDFTPIDVCEQVVKDMPNPPIIDHKANKACYMPSVDTVRMPDAKMFHSAEEYYSIIFHELAHSTGHEKRLARKELMEHGFFGDHSYSVEELTAEMTAAFLCGHCQISTATIVNSAAYLRGWLSKIKSDPKTLIIAGQRAQKAYDFVVGNESPANESKGDVEK